MRKFNISAFFPVFNEEGNLENLVESAHKILTRLADKFEIIIVNDGSSDNTATIAGQVAEKYPSVKVVTHENNLGYGAAIFSGLKSCQYEYVFFSDGDNQFDLKEIENLLEHVDHADVVIGYRKNRQDPYYRKLNAWGWKMLVDLLLDLNVRDIDCAFKLFKKSALDKINIDHIRSKGAMVNTELLVKLKKAQAKLYEVPVTHYPRKFGKQTGSNPRVILRAFKELIKLYRELR